MSQKIAVNGFKLENDLPKFNEDFMKNYNENSDEGYFLEVDIEYPKTLWSSQRDIPFFPETRKLEKVEKLLCSIESRQKRQVEGRQSNSIQSRRMVKVGY